VLGGLLLYAFLELFLLGVRLGDEHVDLGLVLHHQLRHLVHLIHLHLVFLLLLYLQLALKALDLLSVENYHLLLFACNLLLFLKLGRKIC